MATVGEPMFDQTQEALSEFGVASPMKAAGVQTALLLPAGDRTRGIPGDIRAAGQENYRIVALVGWFGSVV